MSTCSFHMHTHQCVCTHMHKYTHTGWTILYDTELNVNRQLYKIALFKVKIPFILLLIGKKKNIFY